MSFSEIMNFVNDFFFFFFFFTYFYLFFTYFFNTNISLSICFPPMKSYTGIHNILPEGACLRFFIFILTQMSLFKTYKKNIKFSNSLSNNMAIVPCICIYFIPFDRPENKLLCGIHYVYETLAGI